MKTKRFIIEGSIEENYLLFNEVKEALDCFDENDEIYIIFNKVTGGDIEEIFELIHQIRYTFAKVFVAAHNFLISAGAFFYFCLLLNQDEFKTLTVYPLVAPILVVFHRPRKEEGNYIKFSETIPIDVSKESLPKNIEERTALLDKVFNK